LTLGIELQEDHNLIVRKGETKKKRRRKEKKRKKKREREKMGLKLETQAETKEFYFLGQDESTAREVEVPRDTDFEGLQHLIASHFAIVKSKGMLS
jgi:hypothetical protein